MASMNNWEKGRRVYFEGDTESAVGRLQSRPVSGPDKIWVVGYKEWAELRESVGPPQANKTSVTRVTPIKRKDPVYLDGGYFSGTYKTVTEQHKTTIVQISFEGGEVVATLKRTSFTQRTGIPLKEGEVKEVPAELAKPIIDNDWTKKV